MIILTENHVRNINDDTFESGTKPNLVAKILATNFGVFL